MACSYAGKSEFINLLKFINSSNVFLFLGSASNKPNTQSATHSFYFYGGWGGLHFVKHLVGFFKYRTPFDAISFVPFCNLHTCMYGVGIKPNFNNQDPIKSLCYLQKLQVASSYSENLQALKQITETLLLNNNIEVPVARAMLWLRKIL
jgi:hypothetical protein